MFLKKFPRDDADFKPLTGHPDAYRWTGPPGEPLPDRVLATIRPLRPLQALYVSHDEQPLLDPHEPMLSRKLFDVESLLVDEGDAATGIPWLAARLLPEDHPVVVCWAGEEAVATTTSTFVRHWDRFWWAGEELSVIPATQCWALLGAHSWTYDSWFHFGVWRY